MSESQQYGDLSNDQLRQIDAVCATFEAALRSGSPASIESQLKGTAGSLHRALFRELLAMELEWRVQRDESPDVADYNDRFPDFQIDIHQIFA